MNGKARSKRIGSVLARTTLAVLLLLSVHGVQAQEPAERESLLSHFNAPKGKGPDRLRGQRHVFPTGEFPADVENVQAAVDRGGVVLLKATNRDGEPTVFNFGPPDSTLGGSILLERDVWVLGEATKSRMTTIEGGYVPFLGRGGHVRIEAINFEGPQLSAIRVVRCTGAEVIGNRITGVVPAPANLPDFPDWVEASAIKFEAYSFPITGTVVVADNVIQGVHAADISEGIGFDEVEAAVYIEGNRIADVFWDGIRLFNSRGAVHVTDNFVVPGPVEDPEDAFGNGIAIANYSCTTDDCGPVDTSGSSFDIERNVVICEAPFADCIYLNGFYVPIDAPVVAHNRVTMHGSFGGITLYGNVSHARIADNRIDGQGWIAFPVLRAGDVNVAESNRFIGNNVSRFDASSDLYLADLYLDEHTSNTVYVGRVRTVIDLGTGNRIIGDR